MTAKRQFGRWPKFCKSKKSIKRKKSIKACTASVQPVPSRRPSITGSSTGRSKRLVNCNKGNTMSNLTASIPHQLTRAEAKRRIQDQVGTLRSQHGRSEEHTSELQSRFGIS